MSRPTPLMLALSCAVLAIDPSVPCPEHPTESAMELNAAHWRAVASYAEAFPKALAKKMGADPLAPEEESFEGAVDGIGRRIMIEAKDIRKICEGG